MKIINILDRANSRYPDNFLSEYYDKDGNYYPGSGDSLARFIVSEIIDTFDPKASDQSQLEQAAIALRNSIYEIESVIDSLYDEDDGA